MTKRERNIAINRAIALASNWAQLAERGSIGVFLMESPITGNAGTVILDRNNADLLAVDMLEAIEKLREARDG